MKTIRSPTSRANPISCVTTAIVMPSRARSRMTSSTSRIISGSSAEVGSSKSISFGSMASARAIATRCCWPPDRSAGKASAFSVSPTRSSRRSARSRASAFAQPLHLDRRHGQVVHDGPVGEQVELLEDHPDLRPHAVDVLARLRERAPVEAHVALVDPLEAVDAAQHRRLPGARRARRSRRPRRGRSSGRCRPAPGCRRSSCARARARPDAPSPHSSAGPDPTRRTRDRAVAHALSGAPTTVRRPCA